MRIVFDLTPLYDHLTGVERYNLNITKSFIMQHPEDRYIGGELAKVADVAVKVPQTRTYMIQELHLPVYHCWCLMLEDHFFG